MSEYRDIPWQSTNLAGYPLVDRQDKVLRLDQNTNPVGNPSIERSGVIARGCSLNQYGTVFGSRLRGKLAKLHGVDEKCVVVGNGADDILDLVSTAFLGPKRRGAMFTPGYEMFPFLTYRHRATLREIPLDMTMRQRLPPGAASGVDVLWLSSPHNPSGSVLSKDDLEGILSQVSGLVVLDQAYIDYSMRKSPVSGKLPENLLLIRTFSKAWGLAGLRVGYAIGDAETIEDLSHFQLPYGVSTFSEELACAALSQRAFLKRTITNVRAGRKRLARELSKRGFRVLPSEANFLLTYPPLDGELLWSLLEKEGILVKRVREVGDCSTPLRITVGSSADTDRLLKAVDKVLEMAGKPAPVVESMRLHSNH